jgi:hypothetical protein
VFQNITQKLSVGRVETMKKGTIEKFGLRAIADAVKGSDVCSARVSLSQLVGAAVDVSGTVQKRVNREGQCKLVIEPDDESGFVVFADCWSDAETVRNSKIRKGSAVRIKGKLQSFGASAVCLGDCRLQGNSKEKQVINRKETGNGKPTKT